jgi:hypothetical protein
MNGLAPAVIFEICLTYRVKACFPSLPTEAVHRDGSQRRSKKTFPSQLLRPGRTSLGRMRSGGSGLYQGCFLQLSHFRLLASVSSSDPSSMSVAPLVENGDTSANGAAQNTIKEYLPSPSCYRIPSIEAVHSSPRIDFPLLGYRINHHSAAIRTRQGRQR